ncbi:DUF4386 domain-containing protein [Hyphomonas sp.]|uniref:DUF4386 domain-containing protein n=1 Tax=Hyphomonas sp. TaxID=87 RepID=UPI003242366A
MTPPVRTARLAGLAYLYIIFAGLFAEIGVRGQLVSYTDPAGTAAKILASEMLYRAGFVAELLMTAADILVALCLYRILLVVDRHVSLAGLVFRLISAAIAGTKALFFLMPLILLHMDPQTSGFSAGELERLSVLSLRLHGQAYNISLVFFGFDCLIIGWLIWKSGFLPRLIGTGIVVAGVCYLVTSLMIFLTPALAASGWFMLLFVPCLIAEAALAVWLMIRGINAQAWKKAAIAA